jgi:ribosomal protein L4
MMKMNKKEKVDFYKVVLSELLREDMIRVVSSDSLKELDENLIKKKKGLTKKALKELGELIDGDTEMLLEGGYEGVKMGLKNVENVCVKNLGNIDWFDIIRADRVILTDEVFRELNKRYS